LTFEVGDQMSESRCVFVWRAFEYKYITPWIKIRA
jgi:hypothetical protein